MGSDTAQINAGKLDPAIKAEWLAALRSGEYGQCRNTMHRREDNTFCCLGVLAHLKHYEEDESASLIEYGQGRAIGLARETQEELAEMNDGGNYIEANL